MNELPSFLPEWRIRLLNAVTRFTKLEYLPIYIINGPVFFFYLFFSVRARHPVFFSATNPGLHTGGLFGLDKGEILKQIDPRFVPVTIEIEPEKSFQELRMELKANSLTSYPLIAKPVVGERGLRVAKIYDDHELRSYHENMNTPYLIQEYVSYPEEFSVLYVRYPGKKQAVIPSFCRKVPLTVTGDGESRLADLIVKKERSRMQWFRLKHIFRNELHRIPEPGEVVLLETIGNHSRGATFYNWNHQRSAELVKAFDRVMEGVKDLYFVRFDLKCHSLETLKNLTDFAILEINGVGGEPAHIYDPKNNAWSYYRDMYAHWLAIYRIARLNHARGIPYMSFIRGLRALLAYRTQVTNSAG